MKTLALHKFKFKFLISLLLAIVVVQKSLGQQSSTAMNFIYDYRLLIPKLDVLVDSAWAKHGLLGYRKAEIDVKQANLKTKKRYWTRNFGVQGDSRYGTFANFSENVTNTSTVNLASNTTQFNYGIGVYLKFPVFDLYNRKVEIKQAKAELEQARGYMEFQKYEIREEVIKLYENLILKQNLLELKAKNFGSAQVSTKMAEKEYKNGLIPIYEYVRLTDITARIETEYQTAKSEFILAKKLLENLTGVIIN